MDELLAILPASGVVGDRKFVHSNHLYSVAALTDIAGNIDPLLLTPASYAAKHRRVA